MSSLPKIGVEEEYQLVDPVSGALVPQCKEVMQRLRKDFDANIQHELHLSQIEMASGVCSTLADVRETLSRVRGRLIEAAEASGTHLVAAGTNPVANTHDDVTPKDRYERMVHRYQHIARQLFIFGCHVHVSMPDKHVGVPALNLLSRWLPVLQALSANSPYWEGEDTGYASYRRELWSQWPIAGPPPHFDSFDDYQECIQQLIQSGAIRDESYIYWDIRLPTKVPTIEFRCADVMTDLEHTVGFAGLIRALVMATVREIENGEAKCFIRPQIVRYGLWHAARYGLSDQLIDPKTSERIAASEMLDRTLDYASDALKEAGDYECVSNYLSSVLNEGCGAKRQTDPQRSPREVVADLVRRTGLGTASGSQVMTKTSSPLVQN